MSAIRVLLFAAVSLVAACTRGPVEHVCPAELVEGDLVVTELRGAQGSAVTDQSQWIELYNASGASVDLEGVHLRLRKVDGSGEDRIIIRRSLPVAAGDYVVIGVGTLTPVPAHFDYVAGLDAPGDLLENVVLQVETCSELSDETRYVGLPSTGTYSLGLMPPTAAGNDMMAPNWCNLDTPPEGTPGAANNACPPP